MGNTLIDWTRRREMEQSRRRKKRGGKVSLGEGRQSWDRGESSRDSGDSGSAGRSGELGAGRQLSPLPPPSSPAPLHSPPSIPPLLPSTPAPPAHSRPPSPTWQRRIYSSPSHPPPPPSQHLLPPYFYPITTPTSPRHSHSRRLQESISLQPLCSHLTSTPLASPSPQSSLPLSSTWAAGLLRHSLSRSLAPLPLS